MAFADNYDFELLKNESEKLVLNELERQLDDPQASEVCRCNTCIVDMAAMALNMVKPLYRVSLLGTQYAAHAMEDKSYAEGVRKGVAQAIEKVRKNPAHD
jgi:competence protein ComFB